MILRGIVFADGEWLGLVVFVIFVVFSLLSQAAARWKEIQREAARRDRVNPPEVGPKRADSVEDEIAEFLRRAAERRKPVQERGSPPAPPPLPEDSQRPSIPPPLTSPPTRAAERELASESKAVKSSGKRKKRRQVSSVGSGELGYEVALADDKLEQRLRETFDRQVNAVATRYIETSVAGPQPSQSTPSAEDAPSSAGPDTAALVALLVNPASLRQVFLASEILRRPEERWLR